LHKHNIYKLQISQISLILAKLPGDENRLKLGRFDTNRVYYRRTDR